MVMSHLVLEPTYIDELTKQGFGRETWSDKLGIAFLIHRSFSCDSYFHRVEKRKFLKITNS